MPVLPLDDMHTEGASMKYINARSVLPDSLIRELQDYIQGGYLYIPADQGQQKRWGELSGYRRELQIRNKKIINDYRDGLSMEVLADRYCLSVYTIRKIIYQK